VAPGIHHNGLTYVRLNWHHDGHLNSPRITPCRCRRYSATM